MIKYKLLTIRARPDPPGPQSEQVVPTQRQRLPGPAAEVTSETVIGERPLAELRHGPAPVPPGLRPKDTLTASSRVHPCNDNNVVLPYKIDTPETSKPLEFTIE